MSCSEPLEVLSKVATRSWVFGLLLLGCGVDVVTGAADPSATGGVGGTSSGGVTSTGGSAGVQSGGMAGTPQAGGVAGTAGSDAGKDAGIDASPICPAPGLPTACPVQTPLGCDSCTGTECLNACTTGANACKGITIDCPAGLDCAIECSANGACDGAIIDCSKAASCTVVCAGDHACKNALIKCGNGPCSLSCAEHDHACGEGTVLECGAASCSLACNGFAPPSAIECSAKPCTGCPTC